MVLSPGRTEPIEKYFEVMGELRARSFAVLTHDWRGQGLSDRLLRDRWKGYARGLDPFLDDYRRLLDLPLDLPRPWIGLGHSMGGGLLCGALARGERRLAAAVMSAPMVGINLGGRTPAQARALASLMRLAGLGPSYLSRGVDILDETFEGNHLTHDPVRFRRFRDQLRAEPDLIVSRVTWSWVAFALELNARLSRPGAAEAIATPFLAVLAGEEALVDNAAAEAFAARAPMGRSQVIAGARHELLQETDDLRASFWAAFDGFLAERGV